MSTLTSWDGVTSSENTGSASTISTKSSPLPPTSKSAADPAGKESFIRRLFDSITPRYDLFNRMASLGLDQPWRRKTIASLKLQPWSRVLDLASGTGDLSREAAKELIPLGKVTACDLSRPMLSAAKAKFKAEPFAGWHINFAQARAEQLPFLDGAFDAATIGFALRNVSDLEGTFRELNRVLKPGGRLALLEFGRPANPWLALGHRLWLGTAIPLIGLLTTGKLWPFLYLRRSILQFLEPQQVLDRLKAAGFAQAKAQPLTSGVVMLYQATI